MGCGASRLDDDGIVIPVKAQPLFRLRLEEFKRRRHTLASKENTPSKKELLLDDREEDESASTNQPLVKKSVKDSSLHDDTDSCVTSEGSKGGSPERLTKKDSDKGDDNKKDANATEETSKEKDKAEEHEVRIIEPLAKDDANVQHIMDERIENEDEYNDDEDDDDDDGRMLRHHEDDEAFPASPSFRVFVVDNIEDKQNEVLEDHLTDMAPTDDDSIPSKVPVTKQVKKGKKRGSFKKVLATSRQAKNLFNVRACISSTHSTHDRTHLLTAKAHA